MNDFILSIFPIIILTFAVVEVFCMFQAYHMFKDNHPKAFKEIGEFRFFVMGTASSTKYKNLLYKREYKKLNDKKLTKLCDFILFTKILFIIFIPVYTFLKIY